MKGIMKTYNHSSEINHVRAILTKACFLSRLKEGNLLGALAMAKLAIKFRVISMVSQ
jgi:hypothetical protein